MSLLCRIFGHVLEYGELHWKNPGPGPDNVHRDEKPYKGHRCTRCDVKHIDHVDGHARTEALIARNDEARRAVEDANRERLMSCRGHVFDMPYNRGHFRICAKCKGEVPMESALWYERGFKHALETIGCNKTGDAT